MTKRRKDYPEELLAVLSDFEEALVEQRTQQATDLLETLQDREASEDPIKPNDPTYPRRKAEKLAVTALYECAEVYGRAPPFEVVAAPCPGSSCLPKNTTCSTDEECCSNKCKASGKCADS